MILGGNSVEPYYKISCRVGGLVWSRRARHKNVFAVWLESGEGSRCIALATVVVASLATVSENVRPGRMGVDRQVKAGTGRCAGSPQGAVANEIGANGDDGVGRGIEEFGEWEENAGGEDGNDENHRDDRGKPAGPQPGEKQDEQFVACDRSPIERGVEIVGGSAPAGT